jgi:hypothetical protein
MADAAAKIAKSDQQIHTPSPGASSLSGNSYQTSITLQLLVLRKPLQSKRVTINAFARRVIWCQAANR